MVSPEFQSLKGIRVNFGSGSESGIFCVDFVSIPERDSGKFRVFPEPLGALMAIVSIPERDSGKFRAF